MRNLSLLGPLLIAMTRLALSHLKLAWCLDRRGPQMMQANVIGMSSLAIISILYHSGGDCHCNDWDPSTAAQPHVPNTSVWIQMSACDETGVYPRMLKPFHDCKSVCCQNKSDLNALFSLVL